MKSIQYKFNCLMIFSMFITFIANGQKINKQSNETSNTNNITLEEAFITKEGKYELNQGYHYNVSESGIVIVTRDNQEIAGSFSCGGCPSGECKVITDGNALACGGCGKTCKLTTVIVSTGSIKIKEKVGDNKTKTHSTGIKN